ncbi:MAG: hypothetical protein AAF989_11535 [Planctomycetota bacterium]
MDGDERHGQIKLRKGKAVVLPAETVVWVDEQQQRAVTLGFIAKRPGKLKYINAPKASNPESDRE